MAKAFDFWPRILQSGAPVFQFYATKVSTVGYPLMFSENQLLAKVAKIYKKSAKIQKLTLIEKRII